MPFILRCRVSGGVTGFRESIVKGKDGRPRHFASEAAASAEASRLHTLNNGPYASARFAYWAEEAEEEQQPICRRCELPGPDCDCDPCGDFA